MPFTGLPSVTWGQLYAGIAQSKSTTQQVDDTTGFLEALSSIDKRLLERMQIVPGTQPFQCCNLPILSGSHR